MTPAGLSVAAIVCGVLTIAACFADWSVPERSLADLRAEAYRARFEGETDDPTLLVRETAHAYGKSGLEKPFDGGWVIVLAVLGSLVAAAGSFLSGLGRASRAAAEKSLWTAGGLFGVSAMLVLLDGSPSNFEFGVRGSGWWMTLAFSLGATFCATFASARLPKTTEGEEGEDLAEDESMLQG